MPCQAAPIEAASNLGLQWEWAGSALCTLLPPVARVPPHVAPRHARAGRYELRYTRLLLAHAASQPTRPSPRSLCRARETSGTQPSDEGQPGCEKREGTHERKLGPDAFLAAVVVFSRRFHGITQHQGSRRPVHVRASPSLTSTSPND